MMITVHRLKTWPVYFYAVTSGNKNFEIRKNDRDFKEGDVLILQCYDPETQTYNGQEVAKRVTYISDWDQKPGNVVLALAERGAARCIAELVASNVQTLLFCRGMDSPACDPEKIRTAYIDWLELEVFRIIQEQESPNAPRSATEASRE